MSPVWQLQYVMICIALVPDSDYRERTAKQRVVRMHNPNHFQSSVSLRSVRILQKAAAGVLRLTRSIFSISPLGRCGSVKPF